MAGKMFSVIQRRDDLPEMTPPLALLMTVLNLVFTVAAAKLSSSFVGAVAALPLLAVAVCFYSLIILLWRRAASLFVTPLSFVVMYFFSSISLFAASVISLSVLFTSYVFAVSLISRESKFKRLTTLSGSIAICIVLTIIACAGFVAESFEDFTVLCMNALSEVLATAYQTAESAARSLARSIIVMAPAYTAVLSISLAWFVDLLAKSAFRLLDCTDTFISITHRISLPITYAAVYAAAFTFTVLTPSAQNPFLYTLLDSITLAMMLPCAAVGLSMTLRKIRVRMYYASGKRTLTSMLMLLVFVSLGVINAAMLLSVVGAYFVITNYIRTRRKLRENDRDSEKNKS